MTKPRKQKVTLKMGSSVFMVPYLATTLLSHASPLSGIFDLLRSYSARQLRLAEILVRRRRYVIILLRGAERFQRPWGKRKIRGPLRENPAEIFEGEAVNSGKLMQVLLLRSLDIEKFGSMRPFDFETLGHFAASALPSRRLSFPFKRI